MADNTAFFMGVNPVLTNLTSAITVKEGHNASNSIASQTLEDGSIINDHIIVLPRTVSVDFFVSNIDGTNSQTLGENAITVFQELERIRNERELVTLYTYHEIYDNMAIESITSAHEAPNRGQLTINVIFKEVNKAFVNTGSNPINKTGG